jgi:hypothetical protein
MAWYRDSSTSLSATVTVEQVMYKQWVLSISQKCNREKGNIAIHNMWINIFLCRFLLSFEALTLMWYTDNEGSGIIWVLAWRDQEKPQTFSLVVGCLGIKNLPAFIPLCFSSFHPPALPLLPHPPRMSLFLLQLVFTFSYLQYEGVLWLWQKSISKFLMDLCFIFFGIVCL